MMIGKFVEVETEVSNVAIIDIPEIDYEESIVLFPHGIKARFELIDQNKDQTIPIYLPLRLNLFGVQLDVHCRPMIIYFNYSNNTTTMEGSFECDSVPCRLAISNIDCPDELINCLKKSFKLIPNKDVIFPGEKSFHIKKSSEKAEDILQLLDKQIFKFMIETVECSLKVKNLELRKEATETVVTIDVEE